jgi:membrane protease YdiL (CAAX protease family)
MNHTQSRIKAILETVSVFLLVILVFKVIRISSFGEWERQVLQRYFLEYAMVIVIPLVFLAMTRRNHAAYGISFRNLNYHLNVVATAFIPILLLSVVLSLLNWERWGEVLLVSTIEVVLLFVVAWMLRNKSTAGNLGVANVLFLFMPVIFLPLLMTKIGKVVSDFVYFYVFIGPGEEILFRGYIQSQLNEVFGRSYRFFGVNWGWGLVITSLLFGFWHVLAPFNPILGNFDLMWLHGFWTFFLGLILGFIREKTGSVVAPAILHNVVNYPPQAIVYALLRL